VKLESRWLTPGLRLNRPDDLEPKPPCEVWPGRVMGDESPIDKACNPNAQVLSKLIQFPKIRSLIGSVLRGMRRIYLNKRFRDVPHHRHRILRIQPHVRISSLLFFAGMSCAATVWPVSKKRNALGGGDDPERCAAGIFHQRRDPDFKPDPDFEQ